MGALPVVVVLFTTCIAWALQRSRWAEVSMGVSRWTYGVVMPLSLLYFPIKSGFRVHPVQCEWTFDWSLAVYPLRNTAHIALFVIFLILTWAQISRVKGALWWCLAASLVMGFMVEIAEGATGIHHCRMRDLIPDMAGAVIGALIVITGGYVRTLMTRHSAARE